MTPNPTFRSAARALIAWRENTIDQMRSRAKLDRAARLWSGVSKAAAFNTWRTVVHRNKGQRRILGACAARLLMRDAAVAFATWRKNAGEAARAQSVLAKVMNRFCASPSPSPSPSPFLFTSHAQRALVMFHQLISLPSYLSPQFILHIRVNFILVVHVTNSSIKTIFRTQGSTQPGPCENHPPPKKTT
jgi:hypothetical protein